MKTKTVPDYTTFDDDDDWAALPFEAKQAACGVVCTAVEGGVTYWASVQSYKWIVRGEDGQISNHPDGGLLFAEDTCALLRDQEDEDEEKEPMRLDGPAVIRGLAKLADGSVHACAPSSEVSWNDALRKLLVGDEDLDLDAGDADLIAQAALLGEVVYG